MRLDISEILREVGKNLPYDIHEAPLVDEDVECTVPIEGRVTFNNTGGMLLVRGSASTTVALPCSRCGEYYEQSVSVTVDEQFELRHVSAGPRTLATVTIVEEDENPAAGKLFDGHVFDLTEMLRQYIVLEEPARPLPPEQNGRCTHCHLRPEEILQAIDTAEVIDSAADASVNPAFANLRALLEKSEDRL